MIYCNYSFLRRMFNHNLIPELLQMLIHEGVEKNYRKLVTIASLWAEIRIWDLSNRKQEFYLFRRHLH
jgi:hypothetical protein